MKSDPGGDVKILVQLLIGSGLVTREEFARANEMSEDQNIPLMTAVKHTGLLTDDSLKLSVEAQERVLANEISSDLAIRALRVALQRRLSLPDAIQSVQKLHQQTQVAVSATNELTNLFIAAHMMTMEDLGRFIKLSQDSGMMIGHLLLLDNRISSDDLLNGLNAVKMIRTSGLDKGRAAQGMRYARQRTISIEQALFELDFLKISDAGTLRQGELFLMANLITREDYTECFEIELFKNKAFGQILLERGLLNAQQVQAAITLVNRTEEGKLKPYQAADVLYKVVKERQDLGSVKPQDGVELEGGISIPDLVVEAGVCSREQIDAAMPGAEASWAQQGAALLKSGIIDEQNVLTALRLKALTGLGYLPRLKAITLFAQCVRESLPLERALSNQALNLPSRVQWTWVQTNI